MGGIQAGAIIAARIRKDIRKFEDAGAVSPATSRTTEELGVRRGLVFHRLLKRGVFIETAQNTCYLNRENLAQYHKVRRNRILVFLVLIILIIGWLAQAKL